MLFGVTDSGVFPNPTEKGCQELNLGLSAWKAGARSWSFAFPPSLDLDPPILLPYLTMDPNMAFVEHAAAHICNFISSPECQIMPDKPLPHQYFISG